MSIAERIKDFEEDLQLANKKLQDRKDEGMEYGDVQEEIRDLEASIVTLKEELDAMPKIKVNLHLSATAYYHYDKEVEVPADTSDDELAEMVDDLYDKTDGGDFVGDDSWDRGTCYWEKE